MADTTEKKPAPETTTGTTTAPVTEPTPGAVTEIPPASTEPTPTTEPDASQAGKGVQRRINELTAARREAERRADDTARRLDEAQARITELTRRAPEPTKPAEDTRPAAPEMAKFQDPREYEAAMTKYASDLAGWTSRQTVKAELAEHERVTMERTRAVEVQRVRSEFNARRAKAMEQYADYVEVAENPDLLITDSMAGAIAMDPSGPAIAYYLGQHPDEAEAIARLPGNLQLVELGAIKSKLKTPPKSPPPPVTPVGSGASTTKSLEDMDMDSYAAKRRADMGAGRH